MKNDRKRIAKISGKKVRDEEAVIISRLVLFTGDRATDRNIKKQIERYKKKNGMGTPYELCDFVNQNSMYLSAEVLKSPITNHALEWKEK